MRQMREHGRDLARLQEVDQAQQHRLRLLGGSGVDEVADRVGDDYGGLELLHHLVDPYQVHFQAVEGGSRGIYLDDALLDRWLEIHADAAHVANELLGRLLEREVEHPLAALRRLVREMRRETRL